MSDYNLSEAESKEYTDRQVKIINLYRNKWQSKKYLSPDALCKKWIRDLATFSDKKVAVIGGNGSAKSTYLFKFLGRMIWTRPGMYLVTSGTSDQVGKLFKQKLRPVLRQMGMRREDNVRQVYEIKTPKGIATIHMKSNKTFESAEGVEYDCWIADEIQGHSQEAAEMYMKRTRGSLQDSMVRITGLPDDPDSWLYEFISNNDITLHEINLWDHPDTEWIDYYKEVLKGLFPKGPKRDRYLYGKRVSLSGMGLFNVTRDHLGSVSYDKDEDLYFVWDFNVEYRACTIWQQMGLDDSGIPVFGCLSSERMNEDNTYDDGKVLSRQWAGHEGRVYLHGDASGDNRSAGASDSMWAQVRQAFKETFDDELRYIVPSKNPTVKDTISISNWALSHGNVVFDRDKAGRAYRSMSAIEADKYGEIDKSIDDKPTGSNSHEADTCRYLLYRQFKRYAPGGGDKAKITKIRGW